MRYINKIGGAWERNGISCSQQFLNRCWKSHTGTYDTSKLKYNRGNLQNMPNILVTEQSDSEGYSYCCYCMRRLYLKNDNGHLPNVTLEHIIPNKISQNAWTEQRRSYQQYEKLDNSHINVCCGGVLSSNQKSSQISNLPHPHFISYHNLVASCDGRILENNKLKGGSCCNNKRGSKFVEPFYLDKQLINGTGYGIGYRADGYLDYDDDLYNAEWFDKDHLNLDCSWLVLVRKMWCKISLSAYCVNDVETAINNKQLRQEIIDDVDDDNNIAAWSTLDDVWRLFSEYSWFYQYYK